MKIACSDVMVPGKNLTEKAEKLKKWGYDGISVFWDYELWNVDIESELSTLEEKTGIRPCEFVLSGPSYGRLMSSYPDESAATLALYKEAARVCAKIGAVTELEYEYRAQDPLPLFCPYSKISEADSDRFTKLYREICSVTDGTEGKVLLETINRYESPYFNSAGHCAEAVKKVAMKNAGLLLDTFHMSIEERSIPDSIRSCGELVKHVHLGDNNRLLPGHGCIDFKACFDALKDIGYSGFVNLECAIEGDPETMLRETAGYLRRMID